MTLFMKNKKHFIKKNMESNKVEVKKGTNGLFIWAIPSHGRMETGNFRFVEEFMYSKNLQFYVKNLTAYETFKLYN